MNPEIEKNDWYFSDNGFHSRAAMEEAHQPVIELLVSELRSSGGRILDLGCGNGAMLKNLVDFCPSAVPYGIEIAYSRYRHALKVHPDFSSHFFWGDLVTDQRLWSGSTVYDICVLMPGRIIEAGPLASQRLLQNIKQKCKKVLVYAYGDWMAAFKNIAALSRKACLAVENVNGQSNVGFARICGQ